MSKKIFFLFILFILGTAFSDFLLKRGDELVLSFNEDGDAFFLDGYNENQSTTGPGSGEFSILFGIDYNFWTVADVTNISGELSEYQQLPLIGLIFKNAESSSVAEISTNGDLSLTGGVNLIQNGGFELDVPGTNPPTAWSGGTVVNDNCHNGSNSVYLEDTDETVPNSPVASSNHIVINRDPGNNEVESDYRLSFWVRADLFEDDYYQRLGVSVSQRNALGNHIPNRNLDMDVYANSDWQKVSYIIRKHYFDAAAEVFQVDLRPAKWDDNTLPPPYNTGIAWFDDVSVVEFNDRTTGRWLINDADISIWESPIEQKVFGEMEPPPGTPVNLVGLEAARGEYETFQLVLSSNSGDLLEEITIPDLMGPGGNQIPAASVTVREVCYLNNDDNAIDLGPTDPSSYIGWLPDPLPEIEFTTGSNGPLANPLPLRDPAQDNREYQPLWFTIHVPTGIQSGVYSGDIEMQFTNSGNRIIQLDIEIFNFDMPEVTFLRSAYGLHLGRITRYHHLENAADRRTVYRNYLRDLAEHRLCPINPFGDDLYTMEFSHSSGDFLPIWKKAIIVPNPTPGDVNHPDAGPVIEVNDYSIGNYIQTGMGAQYFQISLGVDYTIQWDAKSELKDDGDPATPDNHSFLVAINQHRADGTWIPRNNIDLDGIGNNDPITIPGDNGWYNYSVTITDAQNASPPPNRPRFHTDTRFISVRFYACRYDDGSNTGITYFDDLVFEPVTGTGNSFEETFSPIPDPENIIVTPNFTADFRDAANFALSTLGFNSFNVKIPLFGTAFQENVWADVIGGLAWDSPEFGVIVSRQLSRITTEFENSYIGWTGDRYDFYKRGYSYWSDEPDVETYDDVIAGMSHLFNAEPLLQRMLVMNNEYQDKLRNSVDLWGPISHRYSESLTEQLLNDEPQNEENDESWWYICTGPKAPYANFFIDHPGIEHRILFWMLKKYNVTGKFYWTVNHYENFSAPVEFNYTADGSTERLHDPWLDPSSVNPETGRTWGNGDGRLIYPPRDWASITTNPPAIIDEGPTPSIRWELIREGIEDYDYFNMLEQAANELEVNDPGNPLIIEARELLEFPEEILSGRISFTDNPELLHQRREDVAEKLVEILDVLP